MEEQIRDALEKTDKDQLVRMVVDVYEQIEKARIQAGSRAEGAQAAEREHWLVVKHDARANAMTDVLDRLDERILLAALMSGSGAPAEDL